MLLLADDLPHPIDERRRTGLCGMKYSCRMSVSRGQAVPEIGHRVVHRMVARHQARFALAHRLRARDRARLEHRLEVLLGEPLGAHPQRRRASTRLKTSRRSFVCPTSPSGGIVAARRSTLPVGVEQHLVEQRCPATSTDGRTSARTSGSRQISLLEQVRELAGSRCTRRSDW